jgi:hypothetical protein
MWVAQMREVDYRAVTIANVFAARSRTGKKISHPKRDFVRREVSNADPAGRRVLEPLVTGAALRSKQAATMASAGFCRGIRTALDAPSVTEGNMADLPGTARSPSRLCLSDLHHKETAAEECFGRRLNLLGRPRG